MRGLRLLAVFVLVAATVAGRMLPPEHLHEATSTHAAVVHSHLSRSHQATGSGTAVSAPDDDHQGVLLDNASVSTLPASPAFVFGLPPSTAPVDPALLCASGILLDEPRAPESPPPRFLSSRAPPAC